MKDVPPIGFGFLKRNENRVSTALGTGSQVHTRLPPSCDTHLKLRGSVGLAKKMRKKMPKFEDYIVCTYWLLYHRRRYLHPMISWVFQIILYCFRTVLTVPNRSLQSNEYFAGGSVPVNIIIASGWRTCKFDRSTTLLSMSTSKSDTRPLWHSRFAQHWCKEQNSLAFLPCSTMICCTSPAQLSVYKNASISDIIMLMLILYIYVHMCHMCHIIFIYMKIIIFESILREFSSKGTLKEITGLSETIDFWFLK